MHRTAFTIITVLLLAGLTRTQAEAPKTLSVVRGDVTRVDIEMDASHRPWLDVYVTPKKEAELVALTVSKNTKWRLVLNSQVISKWIVEDPTAAWPAYLKFRTSSPEEAIRIANGLLRKL